MYSKKFQFKNKQGFLLEGNIDFPIDKKPLSYALFAHFFTGNKNFTAVRNISKALTKNRIAVMRFDFTGLGNSEGAFEDSNFSTNISDLISAAKYLNKNYESPKIIIGHSLGGAAAIFASKEIESIKAIVTIGAPSQPCHVEHLFEDYIHDIELDGQATFEISGRSFTIKKHFLEDLNSKNMTKLLKKLRKPLLVLHSPQDKIVPIQNAKEIYNAAHHPKSFISLDGANHLLTNKEDSFYVGAIVSSWVRRYVNFEKGKELETDKQTVVRIGKTKYSTEIVARSHSILADEPKKYGGLDVGVTPYELLLGSLGSCTAITLRMYADRKKWDLDEVLVHLEHFKQHAEDCNSCSDDRTSKIDKFVRTIELVGNLTFEERKRLLEIANRCPVHRTLENKIEIETVLR
jgi:putative redox protein